MIILLLALLLQAAPTLTVTAYTVLGQPAGTMDITVTAGPGRVTVTPWGAVRDTTMVCDDVGCEGPGVVTLRLPRDTALIEARQGSDVVRVLIDAQPVLSPVVALPVVVRDGPAPQSPPARVAAWLPWVGR